MTPFVVFGLPRSGTAWLSRYLTYGEWVCGHDEIRHVRNIEDISSWLKQPCIGTVETAGAPWWRFLRSRFPETRVAIVRRPVGDIADSLLRCGMNAERTTLVGGLERATKKLDQIEARWPGAISVDYADMTKPEGAARIFEHCLPYRFDSAWFEKLASVNIQVDLRALFRYFDAFLPQLTAVGKTVRHRMLLDIQCIAPVSGEVEIGEEPFDTFFRDGQELFAEHLIAVGEPPDNFWTKNLDLMRDFDSRGQLQVVTGRCNGKMFGYLMTAFGPTLERRNDIVGVHGTFYASPALPGLGLKMQRKALELARGKNISELFARAGVRGNGPKISAIYRRMGAEDVGRMYRFDMRKS